MQDTEKFATLPARRRTWAVAAVHGEAERLKALHRALVGRLAAGDNLVYLGNFLGRGPAVGETVRELLLFRRDFMARPGVDAGDVVFLRGSQEEMWHKLLQIQFAVNPGDVLNWMAGHGVGPTVEAYDGRIADGLAAAKEGIAPLTQWTGRLRAAQRACEGHNALMSALKRAAFTADGTLLFVNAGIDPGRPLSEQTDSFWWDGPGFDRLAAPYGGFRRLVRGFDPRRRGMRRDGFAVTLDGGCGFGGPLVAGCFAPDGELAETVEA
jgi:serine/threonine protein phosphatase 1